MMNRISIYIEANAFRNPVSIYKFLFTNLLFKSFFH